MSMLKVSLFISLHQMETINRMLHNKPPYIFEDGNQQRDFIHVRDVAKLLNTSHVTLLPHLKKLEKNKILTSRKVGKNKEYLLNPNNTLTKDYLTVAEKLEAIKYLQKNFLIKKISQHLINVNIQGTIVLFGSYAQDYATEASDIDLFYLGKLSENQIMEIKKSAKFTVKKSALKPLRSKISIKAYYLETL